MNSFTEEQNALPNAVIGLGTKARVRFILRTYLHLLGAILLFVLAEVVFFSTGITASMIEFVSDTSLLLLLGCFVLVVWSANRTALCSTSKPMQYLALIGLVIVWALLFTPLLYRVQVYVGGNVIESTALIPLICLTVLTGVVFVTRKDFSFLGALLKWGGVAALVLFAVGIFLGFHLDALFAVGMIALVGAAILYDTSTILHRYPEDRYVAAALGLFASVALMFWYVLRLFMRR